ncbi:MAG: beta-galactosidase trimerization domain-containing protein [Bacteroidales bacterium]|nr:beta-galactosidase trimerization domain-containing protein [Bacteroidales bacterium]
MKKSIFFIWPVLLSVLFMACSPEKTKESRVHYAANKQLPKVLVVTTGFEGRKATLPKGIVIALQAFNKAGATVKLEPRDILYQADKLKLYNVMILSTAPGYHDADRKYSLSYMSAMEMNKIREFVENGGVLISGDNVGRNLMDGSDRITMNQKLDKSNYPLAEVFGVELSERNMQGYRIYGNLSDGKEDYMRPVAEEYFYTLVPDSLTTENIKVLANWVSEEDTLPAVIKNRYGKGTAYLLASSDLLHPAGEGGFLSTTRISEFYKTVINDFNEQNEIAVHLKPWPDGHNHAFCVTLNAKGNQKQFRKVIKRLDKYKITPDVFVSGNVDEEVYNFLIKQDIPLHSRGFEFMNYRQATYANALRDILTNEVHWKRDFNGFRFPYTMTDFWGLMALTEREYVFESSTGANNLEFIHGSVVPHNLVLANSGYYKSTEIMEVSPVYHDDYHFLKLLDEPGAINSEELKKQSAIYQKYLQNFFEYAVKPHSGAFVYQGHPSYVGYNDTTFAALDSLITTMKKEDSWITGIEKLADFRQNLINLVFWVDKKHNRTIINVAGPETARADKVTLFIDFQPEKVKAKTGNARIKNKSEGAQIIFDAMPGQQLTVYE